MASKNASNDVVLPGASLMKDGYLGGVSMVTNHTLPANIFGGPDKMAFLDDDPDDEKEDSDKESKLKKRTTSNMNEYNGFYNGLMILPWDDFVENPRKLNDLFHLEKTGFITFDPDEVNVFFHATRMNKPVLGDVSENGKAWVITVEKLRELEEIRTSLIEKISVFGLTLVKKDKTFGKKQRAPCLLMLDPHHGNIGEQIQSQIMKCANIMEEKKNFCLEINFNGSVERWVRRITTTNCRSVGARLIITNGEEADNIATAENVICCIVCFPVWAIQTGVYKAHRSATYQDLQLDFGAEEVLLHGSIGGIQNQRVKLFKDRIQTGVFYTTPTDEPPTDQGHKYICVKKYDKTDDESNSDLVSRVQQHQTTSMRDMFASKQDKILQSKGKNSNKPAANGVSSSTKMNFKLESRTVNKQPATYTNPVYQGRGREDSILSGTQVSMQMPEESISVRTSSELDKSLDFRHQTYEKLQHQASDVQNISKKSENVDEVPEKDVGDSVIELTPASKVESKVNIEEHVEEVEEIESVQVIGPKRGKQKVKGQNNQDEKEGVSNLGFESEDSDDIDSESHIDEPPSKLYNKIKSQSFHGTSTAKSGEPDGQTEVTGGDGRKSRTAMRHMTHSVREPMKNHGASVSVKGNSGDKADVTNEQPNRVLPPLGGKLPPLNVKNVKAEVDNDNSLFEPNMSFKHRRQLSQGMVPPSDIEHIIENAEQNIIAVNKTDKTYEVDTTEVDKTDMETDLDLSDLESDEDVTSGGENPFSRVNDAESSGPNSSKRPMSSKRRKARYDSRRRYLAVQFPKKNVTCSRPGSDGNNFGNQTYPGTNSLPGAFR